MISNKLIINNLKKFIKQNKLMVSIYVILIKKFNTNFVEFGFSGWEFNCCELAKNKNGILIDGDPYNIVIGKNIYGSNVTFVNKWITLDNLDFVFSWAEKNKIGILSIDVDGNDFWLLTKLIYTKPDLIIVEFNPALGLSEITIPYNENFQRSFDYEKREYFGASLGAFNKFLNNNNYTLVEVSDSKVNAFFIHNEFIIEEEIKSFDFGEIISNKIYHDGKTAIQKNKELLNLPFVII
jgi:hypothetical protein